MVLVPLLLVLKQPDLGTAIMLLLTSLLIVMMAGIRLRRSSRCRPDWRRDRRVAGLLCFAGADTRYGVRSNPISRTGSRLSSIPVPIPLGSGYHANQSKIAVGSGQIIGKGYRKGTQSQMAFLPERHTDFIFAVIAEETGLVGASVVIFLYLVLLLVGVDTAKNAKDRLGVLMAGGIVSMISLYVFINVGMAVGIVPVVGVPLPLVSYGGTSIITTFLALGLLLNIQTRRFQLFY